MSDQSKLGLGRIITTEQHRDAIHIAVAPVTAAHTMIAGRHFAFDEKGHASEHTGKKPIGIIDPFLNCKVEAGQKCWGYLYPGSITSLRHQWAHPAFANDGHVIGGESVEWMRAWAKANIENGYSYTDLDDEGKYQFAIAMADEMNVGPNESSRDEINDEWWSHWENITGNTAPDKEDRYFSCGC